jgi:hypothetical protein
VVSDIPIRFQSITYRVLSGKWVFKTGAINHSATSPITTVLRHQIINNNNDQ